MSILKHRVEKLERQMDKLCTELLSAITDFRDFFECAYESLQRGW